MDMLENKRVGMDKKGRPVLCERLAEARRIANKTQQWMADQLGIQQGTYKQYESRTPIPKGLARKAEVLLNLPELSLVFEDIGDATVHKAPKNGGEITDILTNLRHATQAVPNYRDAKKDLPIWFTAEAGEGAFTMDTGHPVDTVRRPSGLANTQNAYAIYVEGTSMEPVHEPGDLLYVDPNRPARAGRDCVVICRKRHEGDEVRCMLKRLVRRNGTHWVFKQFNPEREIKLDAGEVEAVHMVLKNHEINI
jgi:phage repressor protein C with HTH and peptisase S24 domain/DNA-binding XRE family transcriptional regulator